MKPLFCLTTWADEVQVKYLNIKRNGVGKHQRRSLSALRRKSEGWLLKRGYSPEEARFHYEAALSVAYLELNAEGPQDDA